MQIAHFTIPVVDSEEEINRCNTFLRSARVLTTQKEFVANGSSSFWAIIVEYLQHTSQDKSARKKQVDYKEILSTEDFTVFNRLRKMRKDLAEREGVPVYAVFSNEQLAEIATKRMSTVAELRKIDGVGESKIEKYSSILESVGEKKPDEKSGKSDIKDSGAR